MKTTTKKQTRKISKKQKILMAIVGVIIILVGWWSYLNFMPHPLGDRLEYLGKKDFGCGVLFCDSPRSSDYYYGTDMTAEDIKTYFPDARYQDTPNDLGGSSATYRFENLHFTTPRGDFTLSYYYSDDIATFIKSKKIGSTHKKAIVSVSDSEYGLVKVSL